MNWNDDDDGFVLIDATCAFCTTSQGLSTDQEGLFYCDTCSMRRKQHRDDWDRTKHVVITFAWEIAKALIHQKCGVAVQ